MRKGIRKPGDILQIRIPQLRESLFTWDIIPPHINQHSFGIELLHQPAILTTSECNPLDDAGNNLEDMFISAPDGSLYLISTEHSPISVRQNGHSVLGNPKMQQFHINDTAYETKPINVGDVLVFSQLPQEKRKIQPSMEIRYNGLTNTVKELNVYTGNVQAAIRRNMLYQQFEVRKNSTQLVVDNGEIIPIVRGIEEGGIAYIAVAPPKRSGKLTQICESCKRRVLVHSSYYSEESTNTSIDSYPPLTFQFWVTHGGMRVDIFPKTSRTNLHTHVNFTCPKPKNDRGLWLIGVDRPSESIDTLPPELSNIDILYAALRYIDTIFTQQYFDAERFINNQM